MQIQPQVGTIATTTSLGNGTLAPNVRAGNMGELIKSDLQPRYYESNYRRAMFNAANQATTATTAGLATTYTGLVLSNPIGSTVNLIVTKVGYSFGVAFTAAAAIGVMVGYNSGTNVTHTTPSTPRSSFVGVGAAGVGLVDVAATLPTAPVVHTIFGTGLTGAITTEEAVSAEIVDMEGSIILPPGAYAAIYTSTASGAASFIGSIAWTEVPV